jgi:hypothetical protein
MQPLPYAEVNLNSTLELDTAIAALRALDVTPFATELLEITRHTKQEAIKADPNQSTAIHLHYHGDYAAIMRADLLVGLEIISSQADSPEQKIAAQALLETMRG